MPEKHRVGTVFFCVERKFCHRIFHPEQMPVRQHKFFPFYLNESHAFLALKITVALYADQLIFKKT